MAMAVGAVIVASDVTWALIEVLAGAGSETHLRAPKRAGWLNTQASSRSLTATPRGQALHRLREASQSDSNISRAASSSA